jgi:hypothetical protein
MSHVGLRKIGMADTTTYSFRVERGDRTVLCEFRRSTNFVAHCFIAFSEVMPVKRFAIRDDRPNADVRTVRILDNVSVRESVSRDSHGEPAFMCRASSSPIRQTTIPANISFRCQQARTGDLFLARTWAHSAGRLELRGSTGERTQRPNGMTASSRTLRHNGVSWPQSTLLRRSADSRLADCRPPDSSMQDAPRNTGANWQSSKRETHYHKGRSCCLSYRARPSVSSPDTS